MVRDGARGRIEAAANAERNRPGSTPASLSRVIGRARAEEVSASASSLARGSEVTRKGIRIVFARPPEVMPNGDLLVVVEAYQGLTKLPIDPVRFIRNPPIAVPTGATTTVTDHFGNDVEVPVVEDNPLEALYLILAESIQRTPGDPSQRSR